MQRRRRERWAETRAHSSSTAHRVELGRAIRELHDPTKKVDRGHFASRDWLLGAALPYRRDVWDIDGVGDSAFDASFFRIELVGTGVLGVIFAVALFVWFFALSELPPQVSSLVWLLARWR